MSVIFPSKGVGEGVLPDFEIFQIRCWLFCFFLFFIFKKFLGGIF